MSQPMHIFLQALAILIFISSTLTDITREQLEESFIVQMDNDYGGSCDRNLPDTEEPMLPKVLKAFDDAWTLSASAVEMPPVQIDNRLNNLDTEADFTRLRAMLFGFFGIRLTSTGDFAPDHYSEEAYDIFHDEFVGVNELQFEPFSIPGVGLPKFWCLEDYSEFNEYLADDERVEDPEWGLAAQRFDQRGSNGDLLPGLLYVPQYNVYYRGTASNPEIGACATGTEVMFTNTLRQERTMLYGITACEDFFSLDSFGDIIETNEAVERQTSQSLFKTSGAVLLVNLLVLQSETGLTYQPRVEPEDGNWGSIDWPQWQFSNPTDGLSATSFVDCVNLGLSKPSYALKNAPSYVHFVLCLVFDDLDCFNYIVQGTGGYQ